MSNQYALNKKPAALATPEFERLFCAISKRALIDALWCASQLGTNETPEEITAQASRNAVIALRERGDRLPAQMVEASKRRIDADGDEVEAV